MQLNPPNGYAALLLRATWYRRTAYVAESTDLVIVRVLHTRMDAQRHVRGDTIRNPGAADQA
ncbi:MAG: hypothetical protein OXC11_01765 [Rhodospirillales bacterium]|nr:hypothetical protein [Rhodospirillales bacterium]